MQISILEFSVENFKTFKNKVTFSMVSRKNEHAFESNDENLLKTSFIYGPNASGKSSLFDAITNLKQIILFSSNIKENSFLPYDPFLATEESKLKPTFFELVFSAVGKNEGTYRYSFSFVEDHIVSENLVKITTSGSEELYISRKEQTIKLGKAFEDVKILIEKASTRKESLFLSVAAQFNSKLALGFVDALKNINIIAGTADSLYQQFTIKKFKEDPDYKKNILQYLKKADFCISGGRTEDIDMPTVDMNNEKGEFATINKTEKKNIIFFEHPVYDNKDAKVGAFELPIFMESEGTQKFLSCLGPIIDTLETGKVLFIDEFDNSLHPILTKFIVDLFESEEVNSKNAQLIVTTHDTNLLSYKDDFIKDQFWFTEKDEFGSAKLFSLAEFDIRNDTEFGKKYLEGRFGALPFISSVKK